MTLKPEEGAALVFAGDGHDLEEMLGNLLDNACKWARSTVTVSARAARGRLRIAVEDDGPGLPQKQRKAALQRGGRLDQSVPGSGLGLAIVQDLAALYGGKLSLAKSKSGGLAARLDLPTAHPETQET
jgi:signal transduction histidine kinase